MRPFCASSSSSSPSPSSSLYKSKMPIVNAALLLLTTASRHRSLPSPPLSRSFFFGNTATTAPIAAAVRRTRRGRGRGREAIELPGGDTGSQHISIHNKEDADPPPPPPLPEMPSLFQTLSPSQKDQISIYVGTLLHWNQRMNLTATKEEGEVMRRHVEDSLAMLSPIRRCYHHHHQQHQQESSCSRPHDHLRVIDVGTGAGLPGLILAIACPGWKVTLLESMHKRCLFLENAVDLVGLSNVEILCSRAESAAHELEFREVFDLAVARAVAEMRVLAEFCLPFVRVGGLFVAAKGHDPQEEVKCAENAIRLMGASILDLCTVNSHSPYGQRTAIICRKDCFTPKAFPRRPGVPAKNPL